MFRVCSYYIVNGTKNCRNILAVIEDYYQRQGRSCSHRWQTEKSSNEHLCGFSFFWPVNVNANINQHSGGNYSCLSVATVGWLQVWLLQKSTESISWEPTGSTEFTVKGSVHFIGICKIYATYFLYQQNYTHTPTFFFLESQSLNTYQHTTDCTWPSHPPQLCP